MLTTLGVDLGQGYLIGRPAAVPGKPRKMETLRLDAARQAINQRVQAARPRRPRASGVAGSAD
jgi:EAL domain-containing protein (putative c-di-GMP-specific phosphodiesterase class I)